MKEGEDGAVVSDSRYHPQPFGLKRASGLDGRAGRGPSQCCSGDPGERLGYRKGNQSGTQVLPCGSRWSTEGDPASPQERSVGRGESPSPKSSQSEAGQTELCPQEIEVGDGQGV